jgi:hypothetical protein
MLEKMQSVVRRALLILALFSISFLFAALAAAQTPDTAALQGVVAGPNGTPLVGASLVIEDANHRAVRTTHTGAQGTFAAEDLPAGSLLVVNVTYPGFAPASSGTIMLAAGSTANLQLRM